MIEIGGVKLEIENIKRALQEVIRGLI